MSEPKLRMPPDYNKEVLRSIRDNQLAIAKVCAAMDEMSARSRELIAESYDLLAKLNGNKAPAR